MKKITVLMAMLALAMFAAVPAFASHETIIEDSIVQSCPASVEIGDENVAGQSVVNSQNAAVLIAGDGNEVSVDQSLTQNAFSPTVSTDCAQSVAQAFSWWW